MITELSEVEVQKWKLLEIEKQRRSSCQTKTMQTEEGHDNEEHQAKLNNGSYTCLFTMN